MLEGIVWFSHNVFGRKVEVVKWKTTWSSLLPHAGRFMKIFRWVDWCGLEIRVFKKATF